jgi:hypothetical protein
MFITLSASFHRQRKSQALIGAKPEKKPEAAAPTANSLVFLFAFTGINLPNSPINVIDFVSKHRYFSSQLRSQNDLFDAF